MSEQDLQDTAITPPSGEKLQKVLARIGVGSRRDVEAWISQGRIKVNGVAATLGQRVDLHDAIAVDGKLIKRPLVVDDQHLTCGFKEEVYEQTWK